MKQFQTDIFTFTEIGGVGDMIYKAVRFPAYYIDYEKAKKKEVIVPAYTYTFRPSVGTDYSLTGQDLLASLCNLYKKINVPNSSDNISELVLDWCQKNMYPYHIDDLCEYIENGDFNDTNFFVQLQVTNAFPVEQFIHDLINLGTTYEFYDAINKIHYAHDAAAGRNLHYMGRIVESCFLLERYDVYTDDGEYLKQFNEKYDGLMYSVIAQFPSIKMNLKQNPRTHKIEIGAEVQSVFDIAWYAFARMVATIAPPADLDPNHIFPQGSILTCMACGRYFVRHSSRQRYCDNPNCQAERNNRKARAYYKRKVADEK